LRPASTLQSATGIQAKRLVQKSMGMSAGAFNTREFFHGASQLVLRNVRWAFVLGLFVLPIGLALCALSSASSWPWAWAALLQAPALIAERWVFFAQAKHPQNLYYQVAG
jgi:DMSO reductase anchor subunit